MMKSGGILHILLLFSISVFGNKIPSFHHYTTEDGLFHNEIRLIRQANDGMLWLGTQNGLSSFDGYRFKVYKYDKTNPHSLCSDKIYALETSSANGNIWVGTTAGLCILNPSTNKTTVFPDTFKVKTNLNEAYINSLYEDRAGYLWIAASTGCFRYSIHYKTMEKILPQSRVHRFYESKEGAFWISHDDQLSRYDRETDQFTKQYPHAIQQLYTDRYGVLWGVGKDGLYRYMPGQVGFEHLPHVRSAFNTGFESIAEDKDGRLFLGIYGGGLTIYDPRTNLVHHLIAHPGEMGTLSSNDVYDVFADQAGVVWVGTQEGLDVYDWSRQRFTKWKHDPKNPGGLSNSFVQYIYRDRQQHLWLGTRDNGLELVKQVNPDGTPVMDHVPPGQQPGDLHGSYIAGMLQDSKGRFWVASWGGGLNVKLPDHDNWINFRHDSSNPGSIASNEVISVLEDRRGRIWIGTLNGLSRLKEDKGKMSFQNFRHRADDSLSISNNGIFKVFEDSKGRIWLAINNGGLNLLHEEADGQIRFEKFMHDPNNPKSISDNEVFILFEDSRQRLWVGTSPKGFNRVMEETDKDGKMNFWFKSYQEKDGLSDNEVNGILEDDFGQLWISTNKGLSRFNPENESYVNYSEYDGVLKGKFRKNAAWKDEDGTMYFGGTAGVNVFHSTHFPTNQIPPAPVITGIFIDETPYYQGDTLNGKQVLTKNPEGLPVLHLSKNQNRIEIWFSAQSYTSAKRNKYRWKLPDVDAEWQHYEGNQPRAIYTALPSGTYELQIEASNNDGIWCNQPVRMIIEVHPQPYLIYVVLLIILLGIGSLYLFHRNKRTNKTTRATRYISDDDQRLINRLDQCMTEKQLYLDCKLGLNELAQEIHLTPNQLSTLLNEQIGQSFYDYVNAYRIDEVKRRLVDPKENKKTILAIAWECGFNSKSAFNRIFKSQTGHTPSEYQKKHSQPNQLTK
jgi:ligand-binding sensor domain-containing protein/AraC-like DNA-binding protein